MRAQRGGGDIDGGEQPEAEGKRQHQVDIAARHDLIDGELHVEGRGDDQQFENDREGEDLHQR